MAALPVGDGWQKGNEDDISEIHDCFCPNCEGGKGHTLMLPTKVPGFREIIIINLTCPECGFRNSEVTFGGEIQPQGSTVSLTVQCSDDLNRSVLKSDSATLKLPNLDLEIPPTTQRGVLTTVEGILSRVKENLLALQPERLRLGDVDNFHRCKAVIDRIERIIGGHEDNDDDDAEPIFPFKLILDDPAGNSYIENPNAPKADPHLTISKFDRTPTQDMSLGLQPSQAAMEEGTIQDNNPKHKNVANAATNHELSMEHDVGSIGRQEVIKFQTTCSHCYKPAETDMCVTDIPHFKEVIIMSLACDHCGFRSNEIKGGGAIPKYGCKIILKVTHEDDLGREILKSDTAGIEIPEIELELEEGSLDGVYTTVEGLLEKLRDRLQKANPFGSGDAAIKQHLTNDGGEFSAPDSNSARYIAFLQQLKDMAEGNRFPFTLILKDPLANSFIGPIPNDAIALTMQAEQEDSKKCYDTYVDPGMEIEEFERTFDQNEILGLNDMKTEGYGDSGYYGTDQMQEVPDRIQRIDIRGPDHPHEVGKAPVEGDTTVMGARSANFSVPSIGQRGTRQATRTTQTTTDEASSNNTNGNPEIDLRKLIHKYERNDQSFMMNDEYDGSRNGMVYKNGAQGIGYYKDFLLEKLWEEEKGST
jgi:zinc finger protein